MPQQAWVVRGMCPVHYPLRGACSTNCLRQRGAFARSSHALRVYWFQRARGMRPLSEFEYWLRFERVVTPE
jgi:hypothetical protein